MTPQQAKVAALFQRGLSDSEIAREMGYATVHGVRAMRSRAGLRRERKGDVIIEDAPPPRGLFNLITEKRLDVPKIKLMPMVHANEMIVTGDWHVPTSNWDYLETMCQFGARHMKKGARRLALVGDLFNFDAISKYDNVSPPVSVNHELNAAETTLDYVMDVFDEVYFTMGNHDQRFTKLMAGTFGVERLQRLFVKHLESGRFKATDLRQMETRSGGVDWRLTHQHNYSRNKGIVAQQLCLKFQTNIISHHEHHVGSGRDVYNRYTWINNGMMGDYEKMPYVMDADSISPVMCNGFTFLRNGTGHLLTPYPSMTDWDMWGLGNSVKLQQIKAA